MRSTALVALVCLAGQAAASITVYTNRAAWLAAVNSPVQTENFDAMAVQNFTLLSTPVGLVTMNYNRLSATPGNNPGIVNFGGSAGRVLHFNHQDPSATFETGAPFTSTIAFPGAVTAFGADYFQVGVTPGPNPVGTVTLTIGAESVTLNPNLDPNGNGFVGVIVSAPFTNATYSFVRSGTIVNDVFQMNDLSFGTVPAPCYGNCDASTTAPVLNVQDFACFLNKFAGADTYANCDGSTVAPVLNVQDFACFLNKFAAGCS